MAPLKERVSQLAAKAEVTEGTAEALTAAEAILSRLISFDPDIELTELDLVSSSMSQFPGVAGKRMATITFETEFKGSGVAGTAPEVAALFGACSMEETIVGGTSVTYTPYDNSNDGASITIAKYIDGKRYLMAGCRGNFVLNMVAGEPAMITWTFTGVLEADSDTALLAAVTYDSTRSQPFINASMTLDAYAAVVEAIVIDMANDVALRDSVNGATGYLSAIIGNRLPTMTINPEDVLIATHDFWDDWENGTEVAFTATLGGTAGNICTITAPKVQYGKVGQGSRNGYAVNEIDAFLRRDSGGDELSLAFT